MAQPVTPERRAIITVESKVPVKHIAVKDMHNPTTTQNEQGTLMEIDLTLDMAPVLK